MRYGAIDIGTNTIRLLIADREDTAWTEVIKEMRITRLGQGVNATGMLHLDAMERSLAVLKQFRELLDKHKVARVRTVATSAMRDAKNSAEFTTMVRDKTGLTVEIISGTEEANLTFSGATGQESVVLPDTETLVVDVGGGSTEYMLGSHGKTHHAVSIDIGSVRLTEMFLASDPPSMSELDNARNYIDGHHAALFAKINQSRPQVMVAVAGTATQLSAVQNKVDPYDALKIHGSKISQTQLAQLIEELSSMPIAERKTVFGMHPERADVIIAGALILERTMEGLGFSEMHISERDILDGIIYSQLM